MIEAGTGKQTLLGSHAVIGNLGLHELCGAAAKNKMMQWYNQMKENTQQSGSSNQNTMPPTNAQYR